MKRNATKILGICLLAGLFFGCEQNAGNVGAGDLKKSGATTVIGKDDISKAITSLKAAPEYANSKASALKGSSSRAASGDESLDSVVAQFSSDILKVNASADKLGKAAIDASLNFKPQLAAQYSSADGKAVLSNLKLESTGSFKASFEGPTSDKLFSYDSSLNAKIVAGGKLSVTGVGESETGVKQIVAGFNTKAEAKGKSKVVAKTLLDVDTKNSGSAKSSVNVGFGFSYCDANKVGGRVVMNIKASAETAAEATIATMLKAVADAPVAFDIEGIVNKLDAMGDVSMIVSVYGDDGSLAWSNEYSTAADIKKLFAN